MQILYLMLAIIGGVVPYIFFVQHIYDVGPGLGNFVSALFVNGAAGGISADLLISSLVFWICLWARRAPHLWVYVIINLLIGLSCALPAYLFMEMRRNAPGKIAETI